jgi:hypothetical protein
MSGYNNFVSDFPERCSELLVAFERTARLRKREVTLMLCVAMPSLVVPWERLTAPRSTPHGEQPGHPSLDWQRFEQAKSALDRLVEQKFLGSPLWPTTAPGSWLFGKLSDVSDGPDSWRELAAPKPLNSAKQAKAVLKHIRNALAHGNIFTSGTPDIQQIILLQERAVGTNKFEFLAVAPADFRLFLKNWLEFLRQLELPGGVVSEETEAVAYFA